jgi:hypothetical protein
MAPFAFFVTLSKLIADSGRIIALVSGFAYHNFGLVRFPMRHRGAKRAPPDSPESKVGVTVKDFVDKPYDIRQLVKIVREVLDAD